MKIDKASIKLKPQLSASQINDIVSCPLKYFAVHCLRIESPPSVATMVGEIAHKVLEKAGKKIISMSLTDINNTYKDVIREFETKEYKSDIAAEVAHQTLTSQSARDLIADCVNHAYFRDKENKPRIYACEYLFNQKINRDGDSAGPEDKDTMLITGFIDRIEQVENTLIIRDFKTGKWVTNKEEASWAPQASMYILAIGNLLAKDKLRTDAKVKNIHFVFDYLQAKSQTYTMRTPDQLERFTDMAFYIKGLKESFTTKVPKPQLNEFCCYCPIKNKCKAYKAALASDEGVIKPLPTSADVDTYAAESKRIGSIVKILSDHKKKIDKSLITAIAEKPVDADSKYAVSLAGGHEQVNYDPDMCFEILDKMNLVRQVATFPKQQVDQALRKHPDALKKLSSTALRSATAQWVNVSKRK